MKPTTVLVTGTPGHNGSYVCDRRVDDGHNVHEVYCACGPGIRPGQAGLL